MSYILLKKIATKLLQSSICKVHLRNGLNAFYFYMQMRLNRCYEHKRYPWRDLNPQSLDPKSNALSIRPQELVDSYVIKQIQEFQKFLTVSKIMVPLEGLEPPIFGSEVQRLIH